jgi:CRISPR-associated endonuclease/helicase Cas3
MFITLLSTWSEFALEPEVVPGIRLATHQRETFDAISDSNIQVVFDTALTGDGKTLAATLPVFKNHDSFDKGLFAYPTNELVRDQTRQFKVWSDRLQISPTTVQLNSRTIAAAMREDGFSKPETLKNFAENDLVLTNPDIFTLIHRFRYNQWKGNAAQIAQIWLNQYRYIVFDEFHIFSGPQIANVLDGIAFIRANFPDHSPAKFLFLSATPDQLLLSALEKAGIKSKVVSGSYAHGLQQSDSHRRILHEVDLEFVVAQRERGGLEQWLEENLELVKQFFNKYPNSRGLLIANSVFVAKRIVRTLQDDSSFNISVGENTGLTPHYLREEAMNSAQLIVATSTVDVGVDFAINFLIYESLDAGSFIQRLGRLGRHNSISDNHAKFQAYKAIALVPEWVKQKIELVYQNGVETNRGDFFQVIRENIYQKPQEFQRYICRWGTALSTIRYARFSQKKDHYQTLLERYTREAKQLIGEIPKWGKLEFIKEHKSILDDLETFRGSGLLDVWVYDPATQAVTSMSIIRLLAGTDFELVEENEARQINNALNETFYQNKLGLYARIEQYLKTYEKVELHFSGELDYLNINEAQTRRGFWIQAHHPQIQRISDQLEKLSLTTCVADPKEFDIPALRRRYRLPALFDLNIVQDRTGCKYPVAFGLDALLLDSLLHWKKSDCVMIA